MKKQNKKQKNIGDLFLNIILWLITLSVVATGLFVWQEIYKENTKNFFYNKLSQDISVNKITREYDKYVRSGRYCFDIDSDKKLKDNIYNTVNGVNKNLVEDFFGNEQIKQLKEDAKWSDSDVTFNELCYEATGNHFITFIIFGNFEDGNNNVIGFFNETKLHVAKILHQTPGGGLPDCDLVGSYGPGPNVVYKCEGGEAGIVRAFYLLNANGQNIIIQRCSSLRIDNTCNFFEEECEFDTNCESDFDLGNYIL